MAYSFKAEAVDVLADVLNTLRLTSRIFYYSELSAAWSLELPPSEFAYFHVVAQGGAWLKLRGERQARTLTGGDLVVIPHGGGHVIASEPTTRPLSLDAFLALAEAQAAGPAGARAAKTRLICGSFGFENGRKNPLLALLPRLLHLRGARGKTEDWLEGTLRQLVEEARHPTPGAQTMVTRLTDLVFVQAVRAWLREQPRGAGGWLGALRDPQIGWALALLHDDPSRDWSVDALASAVSMSRSKFAARFKQLVGAAPLAYLTRWRLSRAAALLQDGQWTVGEVARRVGYGSETAFSAAFKRYYGVAPGAHRRARRNGSAASKE